MLGKIPTKIYRQRGPLDCTGSRGLFGEPNNLCVLSSSWQYVARLYIRMFVHIVEAGYSAGWACAGGRSNKRGPPLRAARCQHRVTEPAADTTEGPEQPHICLHPALRSIAAVALVAATAGATAPPCNAKGGEWLPRRHWRRMDDPRQRSVDMYTPVKVNFLPPGCQKT